MVLAPDVSETDVFEKPFRKNAPPVSRPVEALNKAIRGAARMRISCVDGERPLRSDPSWKR